MSHAFFCLKTIGEIDLTEGSEKKVRLLKFGLPSQGSEQIIDRPFDFFLEIRDIYIIGE